MKKHLDKIFLVGPMGAGKTTIGRLLARELGLDFYDCDQEIEHRTGAAISWIFDMEGEDGFRDREQRMLEELTGRQGIVLATGGGAVLSEANRDLLKSRGTVVYLMASVPQQLERTRRDQRRPLLRQSDDPEATLTRLMEVRDPLYREVADHIIKTGKRSPRAVSAEVALHLRGDTADE